jgi:hypothetical protein
MSVWYVGLASPYSHRPATWQLATRFCNKCSPENLGCSLASMLRIVCGNRFLKACGLFRTWTTTPAGSEDGSLARSYSDCRCRLRLHSVTTQNKTFIELQTSFQTHEHAAGIMRVTWEKTHQNFLIGLEESTSKEHSLVRPQGSYCF